MAVGQRIMGWLGGWIGRITGAIWDSIHWLAQFLWVRIAALVAATTTAILVAINQFLPWLRDKLVELLLAAINSWASPPAGAQFAVIDWFDDLGLSPVGCAVVHIFQPAFAMDLLSIWIAAFVAALVACTTISAMRWIVRMF